MAISDSFPEISYRSAGRRTNGWRPAYFRAVEPGHHRRLRAARLLAIERVGFSGTRHYRQGKHSAACPFYAFSMLGFAKHPIGAMTTVSAHASQRYIESAMVRLRSIHHPYGPRCHGRMGKIPPRNPRLARRHCPPEMRRQMDVRGRRSGAAANTKLFVQSRRGVVRADARKGWTGAALPKEYGGADSIPKRAKSGARERRQSARGSRLFSSAFTCSGRAPFEIRPRGESQNICRRSRPLSAGVRAIQPKAGMDLASLADPRREQRRPIYYSRPEIWRPTRN